MVAPALADDLRAVQRVGVECAVGIFARADAFVVVGEAIGNLPTVLGESP